MSGSPGASAALPEAEPPCRPDDLGQVVLRDVPAGLLTGLLALGAALAATAAVGEAPERPPWAPQPRPLVGAPLAAVAYALGVGLGLGVAFAAAEAVGLLWSRRATSRARRLLDGLAVAIACGATLALAGLAAPLCGAFELLLVQTGSTSEAARLLLDALQRDTDGAGHVALAAVVLGLPLLLARRARWQLPVQTAVAVASAVAWLGLGAARRTPLVDLPASVLAALFVGGGLAAPLALDLVDRLVRRARRRPRPAPDGGLRPWLLAVAAVAALLGGVMALVVPDPRARPWQLRSRLEAATTADPTRLEALLREKDPGAYEIEFVNGGGRFWFTATPPGIQGIHGLALDDALSRLELRWPEDDGAWRAPILLRAARAGVVSAQDELGGALRRAAVGPDGARLVRAAARAAAGAAEDDVPPSWWRDEPGVWALRSSLWAHEPAHRSALGHHASLAVAGDVSALGWLARLWTTAPCSQPEVEALLGRVAAGGALGDPDVAPWRAVERLVELSSREEATPSLVATTLAALRRHAVREGGPAFAPAARRVLVQLLVAHPEQRLVEDQGRVPPHRFDVPDPLQGLCWGLAAARGPTPERAALADALARTPTLPAGQGDGAAALAARDRAQALRLAIAALGRDPRDPDALRALARVDLACALEPDRSPGESAGFCSRAEGHLGQAFALAPTNPALLVELALTRAACAEEPLRWVEVRFLLLAAQLLDEEVAGPVARALGRTLPGAEVFDSIQGAPVRGRALLDLVLTVRSGPAQPADDPRRAALARLAARLREGPR